MASWRFLEKWRRPDPAKEMRRLLLRHRDQAVASITKKNRAMYGLEEMERRLEAGEALDPDLVELQRRNVEQAIQEVESLKREVARIEEKALQEGLAIAASKYPPDRQAAALQLMQDRARAVREHLDHRVAVTGEQKGIEIAEAMLAGLRQQGASHEAVDRAEQNLDAAKARLEALKQASLAQKTLKEIQADYERQLEQLRSDAEG